AQPDLSCAELVLRGEQDALVNDWMACAVGQYVYALLRRQPIRTFASFVSLDGMSIRSLPICRAELISYLPYIKAMSFARQGGGFILKGSSTSPRRRETAELSPPLSHEAVTVQPIFSAIPVASRCVSAYVTAASPTPIPQT